MPSGNLFLFSRDGATPDAAYPGAIAITRGASNTAQYLVLVRSGTTTWAMGMLPNSNVLAIGNATPLDTDFAGMFNLDHAGRLLLGRSAAPSSGLIAEFYSDPAAPGAVGLPTWNNPTEQGSVTLQAGAFGYQSVDGTLQYRTNSLWKILATGDQVITNHASLQNLLSDDHSQYLLMNGRQFAQLVTGGTQAFADLVLRSSSHGSKGLIIQGSSAYNEATNSFGIRTTNPQYALDVNGDTRFSVSLNGIPRLSSGVLATAAGFDVGANGSIGINTPPDSTAVTIGISNVPIVLGGFPTNSPLLKVPSITGLTLGAVDRYLRIEVGGVPYAIELRPIQTGSAPTAPNGLTATPASSSQINVAWNDNSNNETGFELDSGPNTSSFSLLTTLAANSTNYSHTGLSALQTVHYRVRAVNGFGNSAYSTSANAQTQASPPAGVVDDFNRGNQTPLGFPAGSPGNWNWIVAGNGSADPATSYSILSNQAAQLTANGTPPTGHQFPVAYHSLGTATCVVKCTITGDFNSKGGVLFRYDPATKIGYCVVNKISAEDLWRVYQINLNNQGTAVYANFIGGVTTGGAPTPGNVVEVILTSGSASVGFKVNGGATTTYNTLTSNTTAVGHGLFSDRLNSATQNALRWDDFSIV